MQILEGKTLQVVALVRSPELGSDLQSAVDPQSGAKISVQVGQLKAVGTRIASQDNPDLLIVDVDPEDMDDIAVLRALCQPANGAQVPVIATAESISPLMLRRLLRDGVSDFIEQPITASEVLDALRTTLAKRLRSDPENTAARGSVITFMRASGGMGATTLAINTAYTLTQVAGVNAPRVCLLDLDPQFGNAALYLDLAQGHGMVDIVRSPARLDGDLLRGAMLRHRSGVHVLPTPHVPMPLDALHQDLVGQIIEIAEREFDYVIIDLPRALTNWTEVVLNRSAMLAVVVQLTVPALRQARRLIDLLQEEGHYALPLSVILNRYARKWNEFIGIKDAEKALGRTVDHFVINDFDLVSGALNEGLPAAAINRRGKFCRNVTEMADAMVARIHAAAASAVAT